jgi:alpha-amylase
MKKFYFIVMLQCALLSAFSQENTKWWNETVFYEIFIRSFYDSDGDGIGDINGVIQKLDYLNDGDPATDTDLGITGIWLMPFNESQDYHGYGVKDYMAVKQDYGTIDDLKRLIEEAHKRGIKIVMDFVINHTSFEHMWFEQSKDINSTYRDWYLWSDTYLGENWHELSSDEYYYANFWGGMPDLNLGNQEVVDTLYSIAEYWIDEVKVDGFRCDAAMYLFENGSNNKHQPETFEFWADFKEMYQSYNPDFMCVGEVWDESHHIVNYKEEFSYLFEFDASARILEALNYEQAEHLGGHFDYVYGLYPDGDFGMFVNNHDMTRVFTEVGSNIHKAKVAASVYLTLPGIPYLYYGEEIGMTGNAAINHLEVRTPMQWDNTEYAGFSQTWPWYDVNANKVSVNVATQRENKHSMFNHYKKLLNLRTKEDAFINGTYKRVETNNDAVFAYLREYDDKAFIMVHNFGSYEVDNLQLSISSSSLTSGSRVMADILNNELDTDIAINANGSFSFTSTLELEDHTSRIYELNGTVSTSTMNYEQTSFEIFPNPVEDVLIVEGENIETIRLFSTTGTLLNENVGTKNINEFDCSSLSAGAYFVEVSSAKGSNKKLFIKK